MFRKAQKFANRFCIDLKLSQIANKQCYRSNLPSESKSSPKRYYIYYSYIDFIKNRNGTQNVNKQLIHFNCIIRKYSVNSNSSMVF